MDRTNRNEARLDCIESHQNPPSTRTIIEALEAFSARLFGPPRTRHPDEPPAFPHNGPTDPRIGMANRVLWRCRINRKTGCWEWQDAVSKKGYGRVKFGGRLLLPHRVVAVAAGILTGPSEDDDPRLILHECDNGRCCNPAHLKAGTHSQNMKDCVARGRWRNPRKK